MKKTPGFILLIVSVLITIAAAIIYPFSAFSADYSPTVLVQTLLIVSVVIGGVTIAASFKVSSVWLNFVELFLIVASVLALVLSMRTMMTPIAYVISGLNPFSDIAKWVYAAVCMAAAVIVHIVSLFFPLVRYTGDGE